MIKHFLCWLALTITAFVSTWFIVGAAYGSSREQSAIERGILAVSPDVDVERAERLAREIETAASETKIDPLLLVALIRRESAFLPQVERLDLLGERGERGLLQVHGVGLAYRPEGCSAKLEGARCQIQTGARFLAAIRGHCKGSKSRWVASYGMSRCASERTAERHHSVRQARRFFFQAGGTEW
jgi:hypothetical protein